MWLDAYPQAKHTTERRGIVGCCSLLCAACSLSAAAAWSKVLSTLVEGADPALPAVAGVLLLTPGLTPGLAALEVWEALGRPNHMSSTSEGLIASLGLACGEPRVV